ncbi:hypothetical protein [Leifsonia sp. 2MCAF36]|uniref:hypothetical protein n=1 Tax=Leifsonia sp. 2MCAF36 TaxID=3232988 RepID=UPI003F964AA7
MKELGYDEFTVAWATYWGRREIGLVVQNSMAATVSADPRALRTFYDRWLEARRAYPAQASIRLMGTPALTPALIGADAPFPTADVPHPASFGAYASGTCTGGPRSELSGDYATPVDPRSEGARAGRALRRATWAMPLSTFALLTSWWAPVLAIISAVASLVLSVPVSRLFRVKKVPLRKHWGQLATQLIAAIAVLVAIVALVPQSNPSDHTSKLESFMTETSGNQNSARTINRLRAHWPTAQIQLTVAPDVQGQLQTIRVRVSDHVYLEAAHPGKQWSVRALTDESGQLVPVQPEQPYTIGVDVGASPEELADRFYEEIYFWWVELHPGQKRPPEQLPA